MQGNRPPLLSIAWLTRPQQPRRVPLSRKLDWMVGLVSACLAFVLGYGVRWVDQQSRAESVDLLPLPQLPLGLSGGRVVSKNGLLQRKSDKGWIDLPFCEADIEAAAISRQRVEE